MTENNTGTVFVREFFNLGDSPEDLLEMQRIEKHLHRLTFENGRDICRAGEDADGLYFIESGSAVVLDRNGDQINILRKGQYFGEYAVLFGDRRLSTVRSLGRTVLLKMENQDVRQVMNRHPELYAETMKKLYRQLTGKHRQILSLSRMRRGILQHPDNRKPLSPRQMLLQYGALLALFVFSFLPALHRDQAPVFLLPLFYLIFCVLVTRRTVESLVLSCMLAALLLYRHGLSASFADALMTTMQSPDNVYTVLVMALMGGAVSLIEASGAVTAFTKLAGRTIRSRKGTLLFSAGVMAVTAVDDGLNMLCAASSAGPSAEKHRIPREALSLPLSILPTVLCSFVPVSLWGIFVLGTLNVSAGTDGPGLFLRSILFNFYSLLAVPAVLLFAFGKLPVKGNLEKAEERVISGGDLWPEGSDPYLSGEKPEVWGKLYNVLLPILFLATASVTARSIPEGRLSLDSACGLIVSILFMFFLYCSKKLMSPEQFTEILLGGFADTTLPIVLYLLTICFSTLLTGLSLDDWFENSAGVLSAAAPLFPAGLFLLCQLMTMLLGSSWAMYAICFPVVLRLSALLGANPALCIGAVCAAGIAGEHCCLFTANALTVGTAIGCSPEAVRDVRVSFSLKLSAAAFLLYAAAGFLSL